MILNRVCSESIAIIHLFAATPAGNRAQRSLHPRPYGSGATRAGADRSGFRPLCCIQAGVKTGDGSSLLFCPAPALKKNFSLAQEKDGCKSYRAGSSSRAAGLTGKRRLSNRGG